MPRASKNPGLTAWLGPLAATILWLPAATPAQQDGPEQGRVVTQPGAVLAERARIVPINRMLRGRLDHLLPRLMREPASISGW